MHYWLAELIDADTPVRLSDEHVDYKWRNLEETKVLSGQEDMNLCLDKAEALLKHS